MEIKGLKTYRLVRLARIPADPFATTRRPKATMPEDRTPDADELATTPPKNGPAAAPEAPHRPAPVSRSKESLHDDDPAHTASNEDDGTEAS